METQNGNDGGGDGMDAAAVAFEKIRPQMAALRPEELVRLNADIPTAVTIALGAHERLRKLRPQIVDDLPKHSLDSLDQLPTYALGALYADLVGAASREDDGRMAKLLDEAGPLRDSLLVAAEALAHRGRMDARRVAEIRAGQGNIDRGGDLIALAVLFRDVWADVEHRTDIQREEVDRAGQLGPELLMALGTKGIDDRSGPTPQAQDDRARAFTLLINAYDDCRRAATYLRWKEADIDEFAPSLRPKTRVDKRPAPAPEPPPAPPATALA